MKEIEIKGDLLTKVKNLLYEKQRDIFDKHLDDEYSFYLKIDRDPVSNSDIVFIQIKKDGKDFYNINHPHLQKLIDIFSD